MKQRVHGFLEGVSVRTPIVSKTYWGRVKPGSRPSLQRALERVIYHSERERLIEDVLLETNHFFVCNLVEPPRTFEEWKNDRELELLETPEQEQHLTDDTILYETARITNSRVEKVDLPEGLVFLGHTQGYANLRDKEFWEKWPVEQFLAERRALREEIARLRSLNREMPSNVLRRLARKNVGLPPSMPEKDREA